MSFYVWERPFRGPVAPDNWYQYDTVDPCHPITFWQKTRTIVPHPTWPQPSSLGKRVSSCECFGLKRTVRV